MIPFDWRNLPALPSLRAYEAAARLGSFSAAARVMNVTHPAVAQQVRALERHLEVKLVASAGRRLQLTEAGTRLAQALNAGFAGIATALEEQRQADRRRGLRITLPPGFAQSVILPVLPGFWADHPEIPVSLVPEHRVADLAAEGYDLAIRVGQPPWPGTEARLLCETRMIVAGAPHLVAQGDPARTPWILNACDLQESRWLASRGLEPARLQYQHIDNAMLAIAAALRGMGLLFSTEVILRDHLAQGALAILPGWEDLPRTAYWAVTPETTPRAATATFLNWLSRRL